MQAYGMVYLKDTQDPLQKISALDVVIIYSKTQTKTASFVNVMRKGYEYKQLTTEEKKKMIDAYNEETESCITSLHTDNDGANSDDKYNRPISLSTSEVS